eukprot:1089046-Rhodomonas_salina.1
MLSAVPVTVGIPLTHVGPGAAELGVFKVDTIGDCFIAATNLVHAQVTALALGSGTHEGDDDHVARIANFSLAAIDAAQTTAIDLDDPDKGNVRIRVGFDVGPVVGQVVGLRGGQRKYTVIGGPPIFPTHFPSAAAVDDVVCVGTRQHRQHGFSHGVDRRPWQDP